MKKKTVVNTVVSMLAGALLLGPPANAAVEYLKAFPSTQRIYLDGQEITLDAYLINGSHYVKLRDVGQAVDFNVYWDGIVQIDSGASYTGEAPADTVHLPADGSQYEPQIGDNVLCDDGGIYTITDVSRWNNNMFSDGPLPELPEPICDWSSFPEVELPEPEARRYQLEAGDYLFIRNIYETQRMQYTLMNLAGNHSATSQNGKLKYGIKGTPSVRIELTIDKGMHAQSFWPWRESELTDRFNSAPQGTYHVEAWDVYRNGVFLYTEYQVSVV